MASDFCSCVGNAWWILFNNNSLNIVALAVTCVCDFIVILGKFIRKCFCWNRS